MDEITIGVVGTGMMAEFFARTISETDGVKIGAVCPSEDEDATAYASQFGVPNVHPDYEALGRDETIDAVYVVSVNSLHAKHAIAMLHAGKHVLVEKPMAVDARQAAAMAEAARASGRLLLELYPAPFEPNIAALRNALPRIPQLRRAILVKDQYSSAYDAFKAGKNPQAFDPAFGGGSILDLGFYPVSLSVHLFGAPKTVTARGLMLSSGVDGQGAIVLGYDGFEVECMHSKIASSAIDSQFAGEFEAILLDDIATPRKLEFLKRGSARRLDVDTVLTCERNGNHLAYGIDGFIRTLRAGALESEVHPLENTITALRVLDEARHQVGVRFPTDEVV